MKKRGRPKKPNPRNKSLKILMTEEEYDYLSKIANERGLTISDFVRRAVNCSMRSWGLMFELIPEKSMLK